MKRLILFLLLFSFSFSGWWDVDWGYCRQINLSSGFAANYSHSLILNSSNFDYAHAENDLADLRFLEGTCTNPTSSELGTWNETVNTSANSHIWVKTETANVSSIAMYYGNAEANSTFNTSDAFIRTIQDLEVSLDFDENSGTEAYDSSGNGYNGTLSGGTTWASGKFGNSVEFDGSNPRKVTVGSGGDLVYSGDKSFEAWINIDALGSYMAIFNQISSGSTQGKLQARVKPTGEVQVFIQTGSGDGITRSDTNGGISSGSWVHFVVTYSGGTTLIYFDANEEAKSSTSYSYGASTAPANTIGIADSNNYRFDGKIDSFKFYSRTLNQDEISSLHDNYGYSTVNYPNHVLIRKLPYEFPEYNISSEESSTKLIVNTELNNSYETENKTMNINITHATNFTAYNLTVYYNNTLIENSSVTGFNSTERIVNIPVVSPLVVSTQNILWEVHVNVTAETQYYANSTGNQQVSLWYGSAPYSLVKVNQYTVEAENTFTATSLRDKPTDAPQNVTLDDFAYYFDYCEKTLSNGTSNNESCDGSLITVTDISSFSTQPSHLKESMLIYMDYFLNSSYNLTWNLTPESTSAKNLLNQTNLTREYFVWLEGILAPNITGANNVSTLFNTTFYDEENLSSINIDSAVALYSVEFPDETTKNFTVFYTSSNNVSSAVVKAYPDFYTANLNSFETYTKALYTTRSKFLLNASTPLSITQNPDIYMLLTSSSTYMVITVLDNGAPVEGAYIQILKFYGTTNIYLNIEQKITNNEGKSGFYGEQDAYYKFAVYDAGGQLLYFSSAPEQFVCEGSCELTINLQETQPINLIAPYSHADCYGNNETNAIIFTYSDYTGQVDEIQFLAYRSSNYTNYDPICDVTFNASSASYICALAGGENLSKYMYTCQIKTANSPLLVDETKLIILNGNQTGSTDWLIIAITMLSGFGAMTLHPAIGTLAVIIGFFALTYLGIIGINIGVAVILVVIGGVVIYITLRED